MHLRTQSVVSVIKKKKKSSSFELTNEYKQKLLNTLFDKYCNVYGFKEINYYIKFEKLYKKSKIKKTKEEENAKEIKIKEKEKTKTEIKKAGSEKGESVFTSSSICRPSSGCISVESNAVISDKKSSVFTKIDQNLKTTRKTILSGRRDYFTRAYKVFEPTLLQSQQDQGKEDSEKGGMSMK